jgi:accessory colonization factor AcfC
MSNILSAFNDHFFEFINDIQKVFPEDVDILSSKNALFLVRKLNPKMIVKFWKVYITNKYRPQIEANDISFFVTKDYATDIDATNPNTIMEYIDRLREPIKQMSDENKAKVMKYIQNLTKLSDLCDC